MIKRIEKEVPQVVLNGHRTKRLPNNINISFKGIEGDSYRNSECTVIVTGDQYEIQFIEEGLEVSMYTDSLSIYHLVGILTWYNLIDKNYKK
jgi:hypothetical protein